MSTSAAQSTIGGDQAPLLDVRGLQVIFPTDDGPLTAVDDMSFSLNPGRTLGVVGESGCGKSITALALLGLVPAPGRVTKGEVAFRGRDLFALPDDELRAIRGNRISMIFQEPLTALNPVQTVGAQIAEVYLIHQEMTRAEAAGKAVEMLQKVGIPDPETRALAYPHHLSGGMRQRVVIAMALALAPDILIADEPTTALDSTIQAQILDLILDMQEASGMAVLFISHNLGVVSEVADEIVVMYAGRAVERAPTQDLFADPKHPYTLGLIETLPHPGRQRRRLPTIEGGVPDPRALPPGCRFQPRCPLAVEFCGSADPDLAPLPGGRAAACHVVAQEGAR